MTEIPTVPPISGVVELAHLGVIRAAGEDAMKFLQGQLTQDVTQLAAEQARLAAFCNAKGRMQASFVMFRHSDGDILLVCSRDLLAATLKRLSMFVMRAQVRLSDASDAFVLYGVAGSALAAHAPGTHAAWTQHQRGDTSLVFLYPGAGQARGLWCTPAGSPPPSGDPMALELWNWLEVRSGVAMLTQPLFEAFVPQMLNYESVGGVSFKKGCYPGQEIVARSQFRGTLKRRACLVHADAAPSPGQEVFHAEDAEQPCGLVVQAAAHPAGGFDALVSIQTLAAADAAAHPGEPRLTLGSAAGAALALLPLPYALLEDI